nr:aminotransferase class I/II-fold pyridoxal phosphate-dependent enzyme [Evansella caseinilytica]
MSGKEQKYIEEAFLSNWIAPVGPNIDAFENEVEAYIGDGKAVAVSSGTAAIHLALLLSGVKSGDRVFCSSLTFVASANPILYLGAEPVFIDSEPETWNMSPQALEKAFQEAEKEGKLPKAVIAVHLYGQCAKLAEISQLCQHYRVPLIEDAAESLGSTYQGKASGTIGEFGIFSFNGNKIITTSSGGMLICKDPSKAEEARFLATQAKDPAMHYQHSSIGFNYRMSNILAGIGRAQISVIEERVKARRRIFRKYYQELSDQSGLTFMAELPSTRSNRWLTALTIDEWVTKVSVKYLLKYLINENIEARHVWKPLHLQPLFRGALYYSHDKANSISEQLFHSGICLPSGSNMPEEDQMRIIDCIRSILH